MRLRRLATGTLVSLLAASGLVAATTVTAEAGRSDTTMLRQRATLAWYGKQYQGHADASVVIPGIGTARVVCRRDQAMLTIKPDDRSQETQMWSTVYHTKTDANGHPYSSVAVKNARVYRWANADDDGRGGTGRAANEGFNQLNHHIEDSSRGSMRGVISQRPGRRQGAAGVAVPPSTAFTVTWDWSGFGGSSRTSRCNVTAVFDTRVGTEGKDAKRAVKHAKSTTVRLGGKKVRVGVTAHRYKGRSASLALNWHGDADAARQSSASRTIPGFGTMQLTCPTGIGSEARLVFRPVSARSRLTSQIITGEGDVKDHVEYGNHRFDASTGLLTPVSLPLNGMVRGVLTVGSRRVNVAVTSYRITNNAGRPDLNLCEIAVAITPP
jgi:hypothetical protein